ncbi:MAG: pyridoxamine 5'-phosphate oxidase family protein [Oscillospiraceae bacterium]|nr:pyridoxamine 5'-phosphate oxidase family protein [Oscillospiraceae bacterium]
MRRKDREMTDRERINEIISSCNCCRLGFYDEGEVYIVPLNFGYVENDGSGTFYFHGAKNGRKIDLIAKTHAAGFELDTNYKLMEGPTACQFSACFQSVIGTGHVDFVEDRAEKESALQAIMLHNSGTDHWSFSDAMLDATCVFKLEVIKVSCKEHA